MAAMDQIILLVQGDYTAEVAALRQVMHQLQALVQEAQ
jgi:hypothetical protein